MVTVGEILVTMVTVGPVFGPTRPPLTPTWPVFPSTGATMKHVPIQARPSYRQKYARFGDDGAGGDGGLSFLEKREGGNREGMKKREREVAPESRTVG